MDPVMTPLESAAWRVWQALNRGAVTDREGHCMGCGHTYRRQQHYATALCSACEKRAALDQLHAALEDARDARVAAMRTGTEG